MGLEALPRLVRPTRKILSPRFLDKGHSVGINKKERHLACQASATQRWDTRYGKRLRTYVV